MGMRPFTMRTGQGKKVKKLKRGFSTKRDALEWERTFLQQQTADLEMTFENFVALYAAGYERDASGKHMGHKGAYPLQKTGALLRQTEDVWHSFKRDHGMAERDAESPWRKR